MIFTQWRLYSEKNFYIVYTLFSKFKNQVTEVRVSLSLEPAIEAVTVKLPST